MTKLSPIIHTAVVTCDYCGQEHTAVYNHVSDHGSRRVRVYAVLSVCETAQPTDYYTEDVVREGAVQSTQPTAADLGLDLS